MERGLDRGPGLGTPVSAGGHGWRFAPREMPRRLPPQNPSFQTRGFVANYPAMSTALNPVIRQKLEAFARRWRGMILLRGLSEGAVTLLVAMTAVAVLDWLFILPDAARWALSGAGYAVTLGVVWQNCGRLLWRLPDARGLARMIEKAEPSLREDLISAVELADRCGEANWDSETFRSLLQDDVAGRVQDLRAEALLPTRLISRWLYAAAVVVAVCATLLLMPASPFARMMARALAPMAGVERVSRTKIEIVEPSPAEQLVPRGDNVPVLVRVSGSEPSKVTLEVFQHGETNERERVIMSLVGEREYSASISARTESLAYRVRAGDGITRRFSIHTRPRPQVVEFGKTYNHPAYSALPASTVREETGDLSALEGTQVELDLKIDQPVREAELRLDLGSEKQTIPLAPSGERRLKARVPLVKHGTYQVHLVATETGFENKFSPQYELRPVPDLVPRVSIDSPKKDLVAPPDEIVQLEASAVDDIGLRSIEQHTRVNSGPWTPLMLLATGQKEAAISRSWDLLPLGANPGDQIVTKLVATDVKGNKAESAPLTVHITSPSFDAKRLASLQSRRRLQTALDAVREAAGELNKALSGDALRNLEKGDDLQRKQALLNASAALDDTEQKLARAEEQLQQALPHAAPGREAGDLALAGRVLSQLQNDALAAARAELEQVKFDPQGAKSEANLRNLQRQAGKAADTARTLDQSFHDMLAADEAALAAANLDYLAREQKRVNQLAKKSPSDDPQTWERLARQQAGAAREAALVEQTLADLAKHAQHGQGDRARRVQQDLQKIRQPLEQALTNGAPSKALSQPSDKFEQGVEQALNNVVPIERELAQHATRARERLDQLAGASGNLVERVRRGAEELAGAERRLAELQEKKQKTDQQAAKVDELQEKLARDWQGAAAQLKDRADTEELRRDADSQFVADAAKTAQALTALRAATAGEQQGRQSVEPLRQLEQAFRALEAGHRLAEANQALKQLSEKERWEPSGIDASATRPREFEWLKKSLEQTPNELRQAKLPEEAARAAHDAAHGQTANEVREEMNKRQWEGRSPSNPRQPQPVDHKLDALAAAVRQAQQQVQPQIDAARQTVNQAAPSLSRMMEGLARASEQMEQSTRATAQSQTAPPAPPNEPPPPPAQQQPATNAASPIAREPEQLLTNQQDLNRQIDELKDALRRDANVQDTMSSDARERARDADDAVAMLREPPVRAADALREAVVTPQPATQQRALNSAADQQKKLADTLRQLARHYGNLETGRPEESRAELRQMEEQLGIKSALDAAYDRAQQLAELGRKTPQEMLAELERELARNEIMQRELDNIADKSLDTARRALESSARQEGNIAERLKNLDQAEQRKNAIMDEARKVAEGARQLAEQRVPPIRRDASAAEARAEQEMQRAEQSFQAAARQAAGGPGQPLSEAARQLAEAAKGLQQANADLKTTEAKAAQARQSASPTEPRAAAAQAAQTQAAQAAQRAGELAQQAKRLADELGQLANQSASQMSQAASQQQPIASSVDQAGADIARAGRHESRLGTPQGMALQQVGQQTQQIAGQQVPAAQSALASQQNPAAAQQAVQSAQQAMQQQLNELAQAMQMASNQSVSSGAQQGSQQAQQAGGQPSGQNAQGPSGAASPEESRQMARTLDRIDAALNASSGQSGQQGGPQNAQQAASQAMAQAAQAQAQAMRAQRQGGNTPGQQPGSQQPGTGEGAQLVATDHEPGELPILQAMRAADWAKLPPKLAQGLLEAQREGTAAEYRAMVETYFRVIAERGKQTGR